MPIISNLKSPLHLEITADGLRQLDVMCRTFGYRRSQALLVAERICGMAHSCGNQPPLFIRLSDGAGDRPWLRRPQSIQLTDQSTEVIILMCTSIERSNLRRYGALAGGLSLGAQTALAFMESLLTGGITALYEKRGSAYYRLLPDRQIR
ncbi:hypothetical protein KKC47_04910 [Patescibacteria group bacterium]|nr:hypothetical protein [Patescibacteria group bacterium]